MKNNKPFSSSYVVRETLRHMSKCVDISMEKVLTRMPEFKDDPDKTKEFMIAVTNLNRLKQLVNDVAENNSEIIGDKQ